MTEENFSLDQLNTLLQGESAPNFPANDKMVDFGLEALSQSSIGMSLVMFVRNNNLQIKVMQSPQETTYAADDKHAVISLSANHPAQPPRFLLLLTAAIRDVMQIHEGLPRPAYSGNMDDILEIVRKKQGDKAAYMCAVAYELNEISSFTEYNMLEELRNMGYSKDVDVFLQSMKADENQ